MAVWRGLKNSIKPKNKLYLKLKEVNSALSNELYNSYKRKWQQLIKWLNIFIVIADNYRNSYKNNKNTEIYKSIK